MAYKVTIRGSDLINLLEDWFGNVYQNIKEEDRITEIRLRFGDEVEITIGEEEEV